MALFNDVYVYLENKRLEAFLNFSYLTSFIRLIAEVECRTFIKNVVRLSIDDITIFALKILCLANPI